MRGDGELRGPKAQRLSRLRPGSHISTVTGILGSFFVVFFHLAVALATVMCREGETRPWIPTSSSLRPGGSTYDLVR